MNCPFLEEVKVRYCGAFPIKKMIPSSGASLASPCYREDHIACPVYKDNTGQSKAQSPQQGKVECPFLEENEVTFCNAFPIKKMIPRSGIRGISPCYGESYVNCPVYRETAEVDKAGAFVSTDTALPEAEPHKEEPRECVWMRQEVVSYRLCTMNYDCERCQFEQMLSDRNGKYVEPPEIIEAIKKMRQLPASQRKCKYMVMGRIIKESCYKNYECWRCEKYQKIRESIVTEKPL